MKYQIEELVKTTSRIKEVAAEDEKLRNETRMRRCSANYLNGQGSSQDGHFQRDAGGSKAESQ